MGKANYFSYAQSSTSSWGESFALCHWGNINLKNNCLSYIWLLSLFPKIFVIQLLKNLWNILIKFSCLKEWKHTVERMVAYVYSVQIETWLACWIQRKDHHCLRLTRVRWLNVSNVWFKLIKSGFLIPLRLVFT
jgi:hypothetical protein